MRIGILASLALVASGTAGCSFIVDPDIEPGDFSMFDLGFADGGADAGSPDIPTDPLACDLDVDCEMRFSDRWSCENTQCFDRDGPPRRTVRITDDVDEDTTWSADTEYLLGGTIFVRNGATLTVRAGTTIKGLAEETALIVTRDAMISAVGTAEDPIVMTSASEPGLREPGDWGGLAMLGRAQLNVPGGTDSLEGLPDREEGIYGDAENPDNEYNCGTLRYVRIEFAGFELGNNDELNGLTLGGCGLNTRIEYVQVHYGSDDGVEVFGGSVGLQWIVISRAQDDSLDWDQGWTGWAQYVAILQDEPRPDLDADRFTGGDNGIEADSLDNDAIGDPRSRPQLYNFTMIGSRATASRTRGMLLKEGTSAEVRNFLVMNYALGLWNIEDPITSGCFRTPIGNDCDAANAFVMDGLLLYDMGPGGNDYVVPDAEDDDGNFDEVAYIADNTSNRFLRLDRDTENPNLVQPDLDNPRPLDLRPTSSSVADIQNEDPPEYFGRPEQVQNSGRTYIGAFEPGGFDWMEGWTEFPTN